MQLTTTDGGNDRQFVTFFEHCRFWRIGAIHGIGGLVGKVAQGGMAAEKHLGRFRDGATGGHIDRQFGLTRAVARQTESV